MKKPILTTQRNQSFVKAPLDLLADQIANLPAEKRALLELRLRQNKSANVAVEQIIPRRAAGDPAPLSFAQQRLWFLDQLQPESSFYNISRSLGLEGVLNLEALRKSLSSILDRHEVLRTTINLVDENPTQVVGESKPCPLSIVDLSEDQDSRR